MMSNPLLLKSRRMRVCRIHDENIVTQNPRSEKQHQPRKNTPTSPSNNADAKRPAQEPETHHLTRGQASTRGNVWWTIAQKEGYRHSRSGHKTIYTHTIRNSRKATERHMRSMWKQRAYTDASYTQTGRPEQARKKGETAVDESHDIPKT